MTEAIACYRKAIAVLPEVASVHRQLGTALQRLNELDEAIESYRRSIEIAPEFALAYTDLGAALIEYGNTHEGTECLRHTVKLDPHQVDAYTNLGIALTGEQIADAMRLRMLGEAVRFFERFDLLLCLSAIVPPFDLEVR